MSEQAPRWHYVSDALVKWLSLLGALYVFISMTRPAVYVDLVNRTVDTRIKEIDSRIKQGTEIAEIQTRKSDANIKVANAVTAVLEAKRNVKPLLYLRPYLRDPPAFRDVRNLHIETHLKNMGLTDVELKSIDIEVHRSQATPEMLETLSRTQTIADLIARRDRAEQLKEKQQYDKIEEQIANIHQECPHEQLFLIGRNSKDVSWIPIEKVKETRDLRMTLRPEQMAFEKFDYVLTESLWFHKGWFRVVITVNRGEDTEQRYDYIIPMRHIPPVASDHLDVIPTSSRVAHPMRTDVEYQQYQSASDSWLIPRPPEKDPSAKK